MSTLLVWWVWLEVIGLAALPLAYRLFRRLPDRGYAFARPLGLLLTAYVLWMGGTLGLLRNTLGGALASLALVALASLVCTLRGRREAEPGLWEWLKGHGRLILSVELLFAAALAGWSLMRAYSPDITTSGGEKFMEVMFLNSIGRSASFPPQDAWLSGYAISYYYFGYVMVAMLTRLAGSSAHLTYNVGLASLFALTCTGAFGLVYNLVARALRTGEGRGEGKPIAYGFLGSLLVAVMGNLEGFFEVLYSLKLLPASFWRWLDILEINQPFDAASIASLVPSRSGWWWWRASRVINDLDPLGKPMGIEPIDEFPGFSFLLGDMHAHVLALPFVLLALAVALAALLEGDRGSGRLTGWWHEALSGFSILIPLCLGGLGFLNTWDMPIYLLIYTAAYGLGRWHREGGPGWPHLRAAVLRGAAVTLLGALLYLPFYLGFQSQAGGILPTAYVGTRFRHYLVMFGPFLVAIGGLLVVGAQRVSRRGGTRRLLGGWLRWSALFLAGPLAVMLLVLAALLLTPSGQSYLAGIRQDPAVAAIAGDAPLPELVGRLALVKLQYWVMPLLVAGMAGLGVALMLALPPARTEDVPLSLRERAGVRDPGFLFALLCAVVGLLLTLSVEFVYLVDNFGVRANTIFKFYFQGWALMALASTYAVYWLGRRRGRLRHAFLAGFWALFALGMVYPILGNYSRAGGFEHKPALDGTAYLAASQPDDYAAIAWLNDHVSGTPVILETPASGGSSYAYEGRVSALTGLPTLLGWAGHEGQWRGSYTVQSAREPVIERIYNTSSREEALALLQENGVEYVYVGPLERAAYAPRGLEKFDGMLDAVYRSEGVVIYRVGVAGQ